MRQDDQGWAVSKQLGNSAFGQGRFDDAIAEYAKATALLGALPDCKDDLSVVLSNSAECHLRLKQWPAAEHAATQAVAANPVNKKALFRRGKARVEQQKYDDAAGDLAQVDTKDARAVLKVVREQQRRAKFAAAMSGDGDGREGSQGAFWGRPGPTQVLCAYHRFVPDACPR